MDRVQRVLLPDGDAQEQFRRLRRCAAAGGSTAETLSLSIGRDNQISRFKISVDSIAAEQRYSSWTFQDLVVNKETEMAIEDELNNFSELLDSTSIGFYSADGDGRFRLANRTFGQWLGRTALEITAGEARVHDFLATHHLPAVGPSNLLPHRGLAHAVAKSCSRPATAISCRRGSRKTLLCRGASCAHDRLYSI